MKKILLGNEAIARGAYEAGCHIAAAYPGTPSTEILETIARDYPEIKSQWSPNEKTALEVAAGASIAGARSLVAMKHVGLNVAADPFFTFSYTGVLGGLVIVNADDPGAWSSQNEQDNRHLGRAAKIPVLEPSDPNEAKEFTKMAFEISEKFDVPIMIRTVTRLSHSQGLVEIDDRKEIPVKEFVRDPKKNVMLPAHARIRHKYKE
jgi:indolepyruvate ferredoxin oxidoreductase alpha subunit